MNSFHGIEKQKKVPGIFKGVILLGIIFWIGLFLFISLNAIIKPIIILCDYQTSPGILTEETYRWGKRANTWHVSYRYNVNGELKNYKASIISLIYSREYQREVYFSKMWKSMTFIPEIYFQENGAYLLFNWFPTGLIFWYYSIFKKMKLKEIIGGIINGKI